MNRDIARYVTAISLMAVTVMGLNLIGCATARDAEEIKDRLTTVEDQNRHTQDMVARMDSVISASARADNILRNDMRVSVDNVEQQIAQLLENYNDLMALLDQMRPDQVIRLSPTSSPGAQAPPDTTTRQPIPPTPTIDCIGAYDDAFILVRKSEYEEAIAGFQLFLDSCASHENVDNAHYWIGECYYSMEQYPQAISEFDLLLRDYPGSAKVAPALYKLARSNQELGKIDQAKEIFQQIVEEHAGTLEAEQAKERLKDL